MHGAVPIAATVLSLVWLSAPILATSNPVTPAQECYVNCKLTLWYSRRWNCTQRAPIRVERSAPDD